MTADEQSNVHKQVTMTQNEMCILQNEVKHCHDLEYSRVHLSFLASASGIRWSGQFTTDYQFGEEFDATIY